MSKPDGKFGRKVCLGMPLATLMFLSVNTAQPQARVEIRYDLVEPNVTVNEPVYVRFFVHNGLPEGTSFDSGIDGKGNFDLTVVAPDGSRTHGAPIWEGGVHSAGIVSVPANGRYAQKLLLNERYQFKQPGDYKLILRLTGVIRTEPGGLIGSPSQALRLRVAPRDPKRLEEVCEKLLKAATGTSNYEELKESAVALSYVVDRVALPYLGQLLAEDNSVSEFAVPGLVRIGSPEALQVLTSHLNTPDTMLRMKIEGGIQEIKTGVHPQIMD